MKHKYQLLDYYIIYMLKVNDFIQFKEKIESYIMISFKLSKYQ